MKQHSHNHEGHHDHNHNHGSHTIDKRFWIKSILLGLIFLYFVIINIVEPNGPIKYTWHYGVWIPLTSYVVFWEGRNYLKIYQKMIKGILDMDALIGLAAHILYIFSLGMAIANWDAPMYSYQQMWEGPAVLIVITNIGHALESKIQNSSTQAYEKLDKMRNAEVILIKDGKQIKEVSSNLKIGDIILVKRGELVPLDGIISQSGSFDYSNITGESKTINLEKGEEVISGSYNLGNALEIKITKKPEDSTISVIVDKIENVSMARPKLQKLADKILKYFVPAVISISLTTAITWTIISYTVDINLPWIENSEAGWITGITAGVTVLAIACPCALGIATPLVYAVSSLLSAENGILINDPKALEEMSSVKIFAFDKTGTITNELFEIDSIEGDKKLIGIAKGLEKDVKHPIAQTILSIEGKEAKVLNIKSISNGVTGTYNDKVVAVKTFESKSDTTNVALYIDDKAELIFKLKNTVKPGVKETLEVMKSKGIKTVMITGDHRGVANKIAKEIGIDKVYSEVKPEEKASIISELQKEGKVAFVGDGFNDSVAMKQANISIAFASGSDITNSLSDISILKNDFHSIENIITLSKMNNSSVKLALAYAFSFNTITIPVAIIMLVTPWVGASIMAISDILVALNAFVYKQRGKRKFKNHVH